jgi:hypothetical protein
VGERESGRQRERASARYVEAAMQGLDLDSFAGKKLHSGITIESVTTVLELFDVIGRPATGHTSRVGTKLTIEIKDGLSPDEQSITLYHEVIEGAMGAHFPYNVPTALQVVNEAEIDALAQDFHNRFGAASVRNLNRMLKELGF